ncbi:hypothetical protein ASG85_12335 [Paenibacillus sp. Soil724D2]|nr:hypothetical protein ASG85_12335 [Paenibacillus sp. Soil724D2]
MNIGRVYCSQKCRIGNQVRRVKFHNIGILIRPFILTTTVGDHIDKYKKQEKWLIWLCIIVASLMLLSWLRQMIAYS